MAVYEQTTLLRCKDENGNEYLLYPITRLDCVDGAEDLVHYDKDQELTAVQKAQFLKNIGGLCAPVSAQANQFLKVSAVDDNGNVTAVETAEVEGGVGEETQSDWNVTDETDPAYIKNKPFGEVATQATLLDGSCNYVYEDYGDGNGTWNPDSILPITSDTHLVVGNTYTVTWNGVECECECIDYVGLPALINDTDPNVENQFLIGEDVSGAILGTSGFFVAPMVDPDPTVATSVTYSIKIAFNGLTSKKIPTTYLYQSDWTVNDRTSGEYIKNRPFGDLPAGTVVFEQSSITCTDGVSYFGGLELGPYTYDVELDNAVYRITAVSEGDEEEEIIVLRHSDPEGISFTIGMYPDGACVIAAETGEHSLKISLAEDVIEKIDPKYLPDDIGGSSGSSLPEVTTDDSGKVLSVDETGTWIAQTPVSGLPEVTTEDAGKFLRVTDEGVWAAVAIPNAEGVGF